MRCDRNTKVSQNKLVVGHREKFKLDITHNFTMHVYCLFCASVTKRILNMTKRSVKTKDKAKLNLLLYIDSCQG